MGFIPNALCSQHPAGQGGLHTHIGRLNPLIVSCSGYLSLWLSRCTDQYIIFVLYCELLLLRLKIFYIIFFFNLCHKNVWYLLVFHIIRYFFKVFIAVFIFYDFKNNDLKISLNNLFVIVSVFCDSNINIIVRFVSLQKFKQNFVSVFVSYRNNVRFVNFFIYKLVNSKSCYVYFYQIILKTLKKVVDILQPMWYYKGEQRRCLE